MATVFTFKNWKLDKLNFFISFVAIIFSFFSLREADIANKYANEANFEAKKANQLAERANVTSDRSLNFSQDIRSQEYVENVFNEIYQDRIRLNTITKIRSNKYVNDKNALLDVVDYLESTGSSFCQGIVWKWHLNTTLKKTLEGACNNDQIYNEYGDRKNGLSMLCREFFPDSKFSKTLKTQNLNTCIFYDSSELKVLIESL